MNWEDRQEVKLGNLGEELCETFIESKGVVVYRPVGGPHPFDRLCATLSKKSIFVAEFKTKSLRVHYPDTGFNHSQYEEYQRIRKKYGLRVFIFFVDHDAGKIYGNWLEELEKPRVIHHKRDTGFKKQGQPVIVTKRLEYPLKQRNKQGRLEIYFPREAMVDICELSEEAVAKLEELSQRSEEYTATAKKKAPTE